MARMSEARFRLPTPKGEVSAAWLPPTAGDDPAAMVVGHGAGAGMDHPFVTGFCGAMADEGIATLRFNFPYLEAGRRTPDTPANAQAAFAAAVEAAADRTRGSVFAGGKSYGGRIASMTAATPPPGMPPISGLIFLGYPFHPPGHPEKVRDAHLYGLEVPLLFLEGTKDPFADPAVLASVLERLGSRARLVTFEGAGHSFDRSRKDDPRVNGAALAAHAAAFIRDHT
jgi:hypothetical protein